MSDSQKHETIADIIAKKRARANRIERNVAENLARGKMTSGWFVRDLIASIREDADRLEAAWKREKAEIEADALNVGSVVATTEKSSAVGDAAAMRDALVEVRDKLPYFLQYMRLRRTDDDGGYYDRLLATINAALSAPPRNCNVGTAEEQAKRCVAYCEERICKDFPCNTIGRCTLIWAQMPYEDGGAK